MAEKPRLLKTSKKASCIRQIDAAIVLLREDKFDCAITLAGAAEGMLPKTEEPHLFALFADFHRLAKAEGTTIDFNLVRNWLKHYHEKAHPDSLYIGRGEATEMIARAITKFTAVYGERLDRFEEFLRWGHKAGYVPALYRPLSRNDRDGAAAV